MWIDISTVQNRARRKIFNRRGVLEGKRSVETCKFQQRNTCSVEEFSKPDI